MLHKLIPILSWFHGACMVMLILLFPVSFVYPTDYLYWMRAAVILLPLAVSDYAIRHIRHLIFYILVFLLCAVSMFFFADTLPEKIYLTAATFLIFVIRVPARINKEKDLLQSPSLFCLIGFILVYFFGLILPQEQLCQFSYPLTFCYLIVFILYTNLEQLEHYLDQNREIANLPGRQIMATNRVMLFIFMIFVLASMILLPATGIAKIFPYLGSALLWLIRKLTSLLPDKDPGEVPEPVPEPTAPQEQTQMFPIEDSGPTILTWILNILAVLLLIALAVGLIAAIIYGIITLFRRFYQPIQENNDKQEFIREEKADISAFAKVVKKEPSLFFQFDPRAAIRKQYIKVIKKGIQAQTKNGVSGTIPETFTPTELEQLAGITGQDTQKLLHELYEKARYAPDDCTKEEAALLKSTLHKH